MIVMKFGGTSVGSIEAFEQVIKIVQHAVAEQQSAPKLGQVPGVVVVTSAMSGVTNILIDTATQAAVGNEGHIDAAQQSLTNKHQLVMDTFIDDPAERADCDQTIADRLFQFGRMCTSIAALQELSPRSLDIVSGMGERMSAPMLAAVLRSQGITAEFVDAGDIVVTDDVHGGAEPIMDLTIARTQERLQPLLQQGVVPIITGFVGTSEKGAPTTLGRGGSDYSAAILGAVLDADEIQIWTDVNGVMTADPRVVSNARRLNQLTYEEVGELAYYGAKVLHPKTAMPAIDKKIPLRVLNTFEPDNPGTKIAARTENTVKGTVKAVTSIRNMNMITVSGNGLMGVPGVAGRTFNTVAETNANVLMICQSSSELSICFVVPAVDAGSVTLALEKEFTQELDKHVVDRIECQPDIGIIAVVGSGMRGVPGLAAKIFNAMATEEVNVIAIAQGSSEANVSVVIDAENLSRSVQALHTAFELDKPTEARTK